MGTGKLKGLVEHEGKSEAMDEAEPECYEPTPLQVDAHHVFDRHVDDGYCDQRFDQRGKPQAVRREAVRATEWATVNDVTMRTSGRNLRNGITRHSRNSRWSAPSRT